jgi:putative dimethyl sulfoxide reductase chaperone
MTDLTNTTQDWTTMLTGEFLALQLLGKLLYEYPQHEWFDLLAREAVFNELPMESEQPQILEGQALLQAWSEAHKGSLSQNTFDGLLSDYTRLFIGPGTVLAPPWESVCSNDHRLIFQEQTFQVRQWYRQYDLQSDKLYNEPDDHIGLEFSFLSHLVKLALDAHEQGDLNTFEHYLDAQRRFLVEHPLQWVPFWATLVTENARTDFWRGVALLARGVTLELARLHDVKLPKELLA